MGSILRNNRRMFWEILNRIMGRKKRIIGTGLNARRGQFPRTRIGVVRRMRYLRRGFSTLVLLVQQVQLVCVCNNKNKSTTGTPTFRLPSPPLLFGAPTRPVQFDAPLGASVGC